MGETSRESVTGQRSADYRKQDFLVIEFFKQGAFLRRFETRNTSGSRQLCPKDSRKPLALTFPDTSLFIKVVRRLERKIDERLRSLTRRIAANRWHSIR